jgi:membrane protein implicated in regulation of membrane protease activity
MMLQHNLIWLIVGGLLFLAAIILGVMFSGYGNCCAF